ncbi:UNVERIFIED_CONTAM: hypothetical protein Slati_0722200 [Sesamum latifolium]|uniref:DUF4283 domain-containing protein n=1 Tax=Sesamum latifolium TaxID=2727402 RepID=A0AAW2Y5G3_9LAMI
MMNALKDSWAKLFREGDEAANGNPSSSRGRNLMVIPLSPVHPMANEEESVPRVVDNADHADAADENSEPTVASVDQNVTSVHDAKEPRIYVGNVRIGPQPHPYRLLNDRIAAEFQKSTRRTLKFIPSDIQNGEVIVRPSKEAVDEGVQKWKNSAVGYFLGRRPYFLHLQAFVKSTWMGVYEIIATSNGFYIFIFKTMIDMEDVIEGGLWLFQGQPIVLQKRKPGLALRKHGHTQIPIWIRLKHLPMEFWTEEGLSSVASGIGKPLYTDGITRACMRLDYARVCVLLEYSSTLPKHLVVISPSEMGEEVPCRVEVEYEWIPQKYKLCNTLGHVADNCSHKKTRTTTRVAVYLSGKNMGSNENGGAGQHDETATDVAGPSHIGLNVDLELEEISQLFLQH